jgi:hypothetical protein
MASLAVAISKFSSLPPILFLFLSAFFFQVRSEGGKMRNPFRPHRVSYPMTIQSVNWLILTPGLGVRNSGAGRFDGIERGMRVEFGNVVR